MINMKENIHRPVYYSKNGLTPVEAFEAGLFSVDETRGFLKGNIVKYIVRYKDKGYLEDLKKAREYLDILYNFEKSLNKNNTSNNISIGVKSVDEFNDYLKGVKMNAKSHKNPKKVDKNEVLSTDDIVKMIKDLNNKSSNEYFYCYEPIIAKYDSDCKYKGDKND